MLRRRLISEVVAEAAAALEAGEAAEIAKREDRMRHVFCERLLERAEVEEARPEWRPEMPLWPWSSDRKNKVGGFDLALRFQGEGTYSTVIELKWSHYGYIDALDEAIWDAFKLAQASATLPGVSHGLLIYLAPEKAWTKPARFAQFFGDALMNTRSLIADHEKIWRWCLREGSASWPKKLPPYLQTGPVARAAASVNAEPWEIRAARVAANGEPWLDLDSTGMPVADVQPAIMDWANPEPGPGMEPDTPEEAFVWPSLEPPEMPSSELRASDVPGPDASWHEICWFAAQLNGYEHYGQEALANMANAAIENWNSNRKINSTLALDDLRGCLFFESGRYHHFGYAPDTEATPYLRALIEAIRVQVADRGGSPPSIR